MKKFRVLARVYDRETREYIQKSVTLNVTDEQAQTMAQFFVSLDDQMPKQHGFGCSKVEDEIELDSPLTDRIKDWKGETHMRYAILLDCGIIDEEKENQTCGFTDF